mgnify:CR=1 FL=1
MNHANANATRFACDYWIETIEATPPAGATPEEGQEQAADAVAGGDAVGQRQDPVSWLGYLGEADFWNRSFQNWQSEMLAVGSRAVFSVYLRQRGSPESKPVGAPHDRTDETG